MFSFIVPVYNVKKELLKNCINSIRRNKQGEFELIIVDDCSTNGCGEYCDRFAEKDARIRVFHQEFNQGVSAARNLGISKASGDWIIFVDADDWVEPDTCERLLKYTTQEPDVIVFSACKESRAGTHEYGMADDVYTYSTKEDELEIRRLKQQVFKKILKSSPEMFQTLNYCWGKMFKKSFLVDNGIQFPNLDYCEDIVFMIRAFDKANKVLVIPERLYHYRVVDGSAVNSYRPSALSEQKVFLELLGEDRDSDTMDFIYYAALLSMQTLITRFLYHRDNPNLFKFKKLEAEKWFTKWPYSEIFEHINYNAMREEYKAKAVLLSRKQYFPYYLATEVKNIKPLKFIKK